MSKPETHRTISRSRHHVLHFLFPALAFSLLVAAPGFATPNTNDVWTAPVSTTTPSLIKPVNSITTEGFFYSASDKAPFYFPNAEGRRLTRQFQLFTDVDGFGHFGNRFSLYYKAEANENGDFTLQKGYGVLRTGILAWEVGKDSIWLGNGYHGSLLLSDNAPDYLLARVRTIEPFRLPWIFSHLGEFKYDFFQGWPQGTPFIGQRISWRPFSLLELGYNQITVITGHKHYKVWQYPHVFVSSHENASGERKPNDYDNDQMVSLDAALDMPFLRKFTPFTNGRIYAEYGGDDSFAGWQTEDKETMRKLWHHQDTKWIWPIPFDFLDVAWMSGLYLTTGNVDFRMEYAQNYTSYPLFYDLYGYWGVNRRDNFWYYNLHYKDQIMGHEMGPAADDFFTEMIFRHGQWAWKINYDRERRGLTKDGLPPELEYQYGISPSYRFGRYRVFSDLIYTHYRNVDFNADPLKADNASNFAIRPGTRRDEMVAGLGLEVDF